MLVDDLLGARVLTLLVSLLGDAVIDDCRVPCEEPKKPVIVDALTANTRIAALESFT